MARQEHTIQIPVRGETTAGSSFDASFAPVLWRRTRLIFVVGLVAGTLVFVFNKIYGLTPIDPAMRPWKEPLHLFPPLSFALGLVLVHRGERTLEQIQRLAFLIVAANLLVLLPAIAIFYPSREPFLPLGLILFTTAAFLPCRHTQEWLAGGALLLTILCAVAVPPLIPEVGAYWAGLGTRTTLFEHGWRIMGVTLLAGVSVLVSRSLNRLHRSAHSARRLGNYVIEKELGQGGMGKVYVARHALICRPTAIKVLSTPEGGAEAAGLARFEREVRLSASLTHPNTITIFDFGRTADDTFYYAMEYLDGLDLQRMVESFGPLPEERVTYLLRQMCGSLGEAHGRGIVHRDVKPSNIFVTERGGLNDFVKVLDFGLARQIRDGGDTSLTKTGMVFGTPRYIAPESVAGQKRTDARSDLYNVGGVAYWLLTGRPLFSSTSSIDLIIDHVKTIPDPPSAVSELPISPELDAIVMKLLEKDPDARYQTAEEVVEALRHVPLANRWDQRRAHEWWDLHAPRLAPVGVYGDERSGVGDPRPGAIAPAVGV